MSPPRLAACFLTVLLTHCACAAPSTAQPVADFYVATVGNDAWSGRLPTPNAAKTDGPFATPARACDAIRDLRKTKSDVQPKSVSLRGGRYELNAPLSFTSPDTNIRFAAHPGESPVLSGGNLLDKVRIENGLWIIPLPNGTSHFRHIAVGGAMRRPTRWPKVGHFPIAGLAGADPKANYRTPADRFEYAADQIDPKWSNLGDIDVIVLHFWVAGYYRIKEIDAKGRIVTLDRKSIRRFTEDGGAKPGRFYLLNVPGPIAPGEYYCDRAAGTLRYRPMPGETPETSPVVVPRLASLVRFEGLPLEKDRTVNGVEFRGITFSDTTWHEGEKVAGDLQAAQHVSGSIQLRGANGCTFADCRFVNLGGYGIELGDGCRDNRIIGNELTQIGAGGIRINGGGSSSPPGARTGNNLIADNRIHRIGEIFHAGTGIVSMHADRNRILHNHIHHGYYTGISVGWVWGYGPSVSTNNVIEGNRIHDIGQNVLSDMGGIYLLGVSPGTVVRGNVIHDVESFGYGGWGLYTDEGSTGVVLENNLVYRTKSGGFHQHYGKENVIRNNIFAFAREGQIMRTRAEPHTSFTFERNIVYFRNAPLFAKNWKDDRFTVESNLYWDADGKAIPFPGGTLKDWQARGHDKTSLIADPQFADPEKGDFRLKPGSPAEKIGFVPFDASTAGVRLKEQRD